MGRRQLFPQWVVLRSQMLILKIWSAGSLYEKDLQESRLLQGTYGPLKLTGNARALQGNAFNSNNPEARILAKRHKYTSTQAKDAAVIHGDVDINNLDDFFNGSKNFHHYSNQGES